LVHLRIAPKTPKPHFNKNNEKDIISFINILKKSLSFSFIFLFFFFDFFMSLSLYLLETL